MSFPLAIFVPFVSSAVETRLQASRQRVSTALDTNGEVDACG